MGWLCQKMVGFSNTISGDCSLLFIGSWLLKKHKLERFLKRTPMLLYRHEEIWTTKLGLIFLACEALGEKWCIHQLGTRNMTSKIRESGSLGADRALSKSYLIFKRLRAQNWNVLFGAKLGYQILLGTSQWKSLDLILRSSIVCTHSDTQFSVMTADDL